MRFKIEIELDKEEIPKDKNRIFISLFKTILKESDKQTYYKLYDVGKTYRKDFTFSLNMPNCIFNKETITIPDKKVGLYFSTSDLSLGISFYNAYIKFIGKEVDYKDIKLKIVNISLINDRVFVSDSAVFRTSSPIVVREHDRDNNKDWYHDLSSLEGFNLFLKSLKDQILESLPESKYDLGDLEVEVLSNKTVKVKHYGIEVLSNLSRLNIKSKPYILNYIYNSGILSFKNSGFGMLVVE